MEDLEEIKKNNISYESETQLRITKVIETRIGYNNISLGRLNRQLKADEIDEHRNFGCSLYNECLDWVSESTQNTRPQKVYMISFSCRPCPNFKK